MELKEGVLYMWGLLFFPFKLLSANWLFNDVSVLMSWSWSCMMLVFLTLPSLQPQIDSWTRSVFLLGPSKCISRWAETALRSSVWITIKCDPQVAYQGSLARRSGNLSLLTPGILHRSQCCCWRTSLWSADSSQLAQSVVQGLWPSLVCGAELWLHPDAA